MDDIGKRLKRDAGKIRAEVTPALTSRIRASIEAQAPPRSETRKAISYRLWLAASVSGAAAAVLAVALLPRGTERPPVAEAPVARTVPEYVESIDRVFPLQVEEAEFTAPLEEELQNLQADLEKARRSVAEDISF